MDLKTIITILVVTAIIGFGALILLTTKKATEEEVPAEHQNTEQSETAMLAGGCFWCVEADLEKLPGVISVESGYAGGKGDNPTYENYADLGHKEVVEVTYDPEQISYSELVYYHLKHIDPTDGNGSFYDRGEEYSPAIYYKNEEERSEAETILNKIGEAGVFDEELAVDIEPKTEFYKAEEYHQDYYKKNPVRYKYYRFSSGRDKFIEEHWGEEANLIEDITMDTNENTTNYPWTNFQKPSVNELKEKLTDIQYKVTQEDGTERAFSNPYDKHYEAGIYVDIISGEPLFSSRDKYDSGTGWPSFVKPITSDAVTLREDQKLFFTRTEVRSRYADSHLGHVFDDGPKDRGGKRYCMNSAALRFIAKDEMESEGYSDFLKYVE